MPEPFVFPCRRWGVVALLVLLVHGFAACAAPARPKPRPQAPRPTPTAARPAPAEADVGRILAGTWLRQRGPQSEGFRLHPDGSLELVRVAPLQGISWRVEGRRLFLRMRALRDGDLYEDELFLRRLTDRSLVVEAGDSFFAGSYERYRSAAPAPSASPTPARAPTGRDLTEPMRLQRIDPKTLADHRSWSAVVAALGGCGERLNRSLCPRYYSDTARTTLLVEVCQPVQGFDPGVHIFDDLGFRSSYPWFDSGFGRFVCDNRCDDPDLCVYDVTAIEALGRPTEMVHRFSIARVAGWVRLALGADGSVRGIERKIYSDGREKQPTPQP